MSAVYDCVCSFLRSLFQATRVDILRFGADFENTKQVEVGSCGCERDRYCLLFKRTKLEVCR